MGDPDSRGRGENRKGVLLVALWIIAIILIIVFFPILFGVAATAAMVIIPLGAMAVSIGTIIYFAGAAVTNPQLGRRVALGIMLLHVFLHLPPILHWMYAHNNGIFYQISPIVTAYAVCLLMLTKNRGVGGRKGIIGIVLLMLGALFQTVISAAGRELLNGPLGVAISFWLLTIAGYVVLLMVPAHSETSDAEKNGVVLITCGFLVSDVFTLLRNLLLTVGVTGMPGILSMAFSYGSLLLLIVGTVLFAKSMLDGAKAAKS